MKIEVTRDDIENGRRSSPTGCPIARALLRQTGRQYNVEQDIVVNVINEDLLCYNLPLEASKFIEAFDVLGFNHTWFGFGKVQPFSFELALPEPQPEPDVIQLLEQAVKSEAQAETAEVEEIHSPIPV